jgi:ribosomal protein S18 acetylase RimI-like enzyme
MNGTTVMVATLNDVPLLLDMMEDFNRIEQTTWNRVDGAPALRRLLGDRDLGIVGLLVESDKVVGYFILSWGYDLEWNGRDAFLTDLYLVPPARGRGLGRSFFAEIETKARECETQALHLMVRPENTAARRLYEGAGYRSPPRILLSKDLR